MTQIKQILTDLWLRHGRFIQILFLYTDDVDSDDADYELHYLPPPYPLPPGEGGGNHAADK